MTSRISLDRRHFLSGAGAATLALRAGSACAEEFPARPVRVVIPFTPGGGTDFIGRVVAEHMSKAAGQNFYIENKSGAAGAIGMRDVVAATADGYTLLVMDTSLVITPHINPKAGLSPALLTPVALLGTFPSVLVAHPSLPANTVPELIAYARANPDAINFGSGGTGTGPHLQGELFKIMAGIAMRHVPYRGASAAMQDLVGGSIQVQFTAAPSALSFIQGGQLKLLATTGAKRLPMLDHAPTMIEAGLPDYVSAQWFGMLAPARTPQAVVARLNALAGAALTDPAVAKRISEQGGLLSPGTAADFAAFIERELKSWGEIARIAKVAVE